ncbi:unnamed protein product [Effrenium voratum]|nr:unnamed protein product [Effrenium voratum]
MVGDLPTLSASSQWTAAYLRPSQVLLWSGDDQRGAYYAWALPADWRPFMAFRWPVPGHVVGCPDQREVFLASAVIPMGWKNAVSLFQHLHRQLGLSPVPAGAGLPPDWEWRRDRPVPGSAVAEGGGWIQYYLDDFDAPEFVDRTDWQRLRGILSATHRRQREAYARKGVGISQDKAHVRELAVNRMGAHIDGDKGFVSVPEQKFLECGWMCVWLLSQPAVGRKSLLMVLGRFVRCFEFRRPLMGLLNDVWPRQNWILRRSLKAAAIRELIRALGCLPLAVGSLRTEPSGMVTCSDASLHGAGLCASAGLTQEGKAMLANVEAGDVPAFRPAGALTYNAGNGLRILAICLFDGLGASVCALTRLPCQVVGFASAEADKAAKRLLRRRWPGLIELGDISNVDRHVLEQLHTSINHGLDMVLVGAGSPSRESLQGEAPRRFFELSRVLDLLRDIFSVPVHYFVEGSFDMSAEHRNLFSRVLCTTPVLLDAKWVSWCHRPRLFWCSWEVFPLQGEHMENWGDYKELRVPLCREDASAWLDVNSVWNGESNGWLPALTCPHYRKQPNPSVMADLDLASQEAIRRWTEDHFRFPVGTYEAKNMVTGPDQALRLPSASEREALMGFDRGYITQAISPKCSPSEVLNLVGTLVGRSSHVCVITILLHSLLVQFGLEPVRNLERLVAARQVASAGWLLYPRFVPRGLETPDTAQLVLHFIRQAEKGGTDIRLDVGVPFRMQAWPRAAVALGFINEAAGLLVAFDCMLRSGELYTLKVKDVKFMRKRAVLNLNQSKAGKRAGHSEMVVVESRLAFKWLKQACSGRSKEERLLSKGPAFFRKLFHAMTGFFNAEGLLTVYSLRRGGATWDFLHHQSMERTLLRGRWSTAHTARIYLQDAVATVSHLQLTAEQRQLAHFLLRRLKP